MYKIVDENGDTLGMVSGVVRCKSNRNGVPIPDFDGGGFIAHVNGQDVAYNVDGAPAVTLEDEAPQTAQTLTDVQDALVEVAGIAVENDGGLTDSYAALTELAGMVTALEARVAALEAVETPSTEGEAS